MKILILLLSLCVAAPAVAGSWITLGTYELSTSSTSTSIDVNEKIDKIEAIRFQIDGQTVAFKSIKATAVEGNTTSLRNPGILKAGEGSGLISVGEKATKLKSIDFSYSINAETSAPAKLTVRVKN